MMSSYNIRAATETDQAAIKAIVRAAQINPMGLNWQRFLVAEQDGQIVGVGQVKPHGDGSREVASIATIPEQQGKGIATAIIRTLLERESGTLYLMCQRQMAGFYERFGFRRAEASELTTYFRRMMRMASVPSTIASVFMGDGIRLVVMIRDQPEP
jgi:N-acetylglutamate synthase-like GNAT family acetyltransferase